MARALESVEVRAVVDGFQVVAKPRGSAPLFLMTGRGRVRCFKSWETCMRYLRSLGITHLTVEMAEWKPGALRYAR